MQEKQLILIFLQKEKKNKFKILIEDISTNQLKYFTSKKQIYQKLNLSKSTLDRILNNNINKFKNLTIKQIIWD